MDQFNIQVVGIVNDLMQIKGIISDDQTIQWIDKTIVFLNEMINPLSSQNYVNSLISTAFWAFHTAYDTIYDKMFASYKTEAEHDADPLNIAFNALLERIECMTLPDM